MTAYANLKSSSNESPGSLQLPASQILPLADSCRAFRRRVKALANRQNRMCDWRRRGVLQRKISSQPHPGPIHLRRAYTLDLLVRDSLFVCLCLPCRLSFSLCLSLSLSISLSRSPPFVLFPCSDCLRVCVGSVPISTLRAAQEIIIRLV